MADLHEGGDAIAQAVADANQQTDEQGIEAPEAAPQSSSGTDEGATTEEQQALILGKFKDHDAVIEAYKNLEPEYTQTRQQLAELQRQVEEFQSQQAQPEPASPFGYAAPAVEQLREYALQDPANAFVMSLQHADEFGLQAQQVQSELFAHWMSVDPWSAQRYAAQYAQWEAQQNQPDADEPDYMAQWASEQMAGGAVAWAQQHLYAFDTYKDQVNAWIDANPRIVEAITAQTPGPEGLTNLLSFAYKQVRTFDQPQTDATQAAAPPPPAAPPPATRGQSRSTAPAADDNYEAGIADLLLKSAREQGMQVHRAS